MKLDERVQQLRKRELRLGRPPVPKTLQGVTKERVRQVLEELDKNTDDRVDAIFALLDDVTNSWFTTVTPGTKFCAGATTAHIACHVGILQRGTGKLDREGRDYWIKPLREIGAVEAIYVDKATKTFLSGHPRAKSPRSAYRLDANFVRVLKSTEAQWPLQLKHWIQDDTLRLRLMFQAEQAAAARASVGSEHADLIRACCNDYAPRFLPGYAVIFVDDTDGNRITDEDRRGLHRAGLDLSLGDAMPDVLLHNPSKNAIWIIEAVISDGEVDEHKARSLRALAERHRKAHVGFTTAYPTWKVAAARQAAHKNIATDTFVWIRDDASKHFLAQSFAAPV